MCQKSPLCSGHCGWYVVESLHGDILKTCWAWFWLTDSSFTGDLAWSYQIMSLYLDGHKGSLLLSCALHRISTEFPGTQWGDSTPAGQNSKYRLPVSPPQSVHRNDEQNLFLSCSLVAVSAKPCGVSLCVCTFYHLTRDRGASMLGFLLCNAPTSLLHYSETSSCFWSTVFNSICSGK